MSIGKNDGQGEKFYVTTSHDKRHTGSPAKCGDNLGDKVCNIYDLEGNFYELAAEKAGNDFCRRGASYNYRGEIAAFRYPRIEAYNGITSFRIVLYV